MTQSAPAFSSGRKSIFRDNRHSGADDRTALPLVSVPIGRPKARAEVLRAAQYTEVDMNARREYLVKQRVFPMGSDPVQVMNRSLCEGLRIPGDERMPSGIFR